jgi:tripartite-type tricarboxylate transporter receptor subunit TctC
LPPGTPKDRVQLLRKGFQETLKDPEFLADAQRSKLGVDPVSGEEVERTIAGLFKLDAGLIAKMKDVLYK